MAKAANTKLIGLFVLAGIALMIAAIMIFGSGRLFQPVRHFTMFFTNSVQGLNVGAPVMFRGVAVGQVRSIELLFKPSVPLFLTKVQVDLFPDRYRAIGSVDDASELQIHRLVAEGLRAQLIPVSLVTGQLGIGMDVVPNTAVVLFAGTPGIPANPDAPEIPTAPSTIERLETSVQRILAVIEKADFNELSQDIDEMIESLRALITMPELRDMIVKADETVGNANATMKDVKALVGRIDRDVGPALSSLRTTMATADAAMTDARKLVPGLQQDLAQVGPLLNKLGGALTIAETLLKNANTSVEPGSPLQYEIANTMRELTLTLRSVRGLADALEQSPNSVLFGKVSGERP
jgi:paraquat-inducible protein B